MVTTATGLILLFVLQAASLSEEEVKVCNPEDKNVAGCKLEPSDVSPYASYIHESPKINARERPLTAKFVNLLTDKVQMYWDNGTPEGKFQGGIAYGEITHGTYTTHTFFFKSKATGKEVGRFTMSEDDPLYILHGNDPEILNSEKYKKYVKEREFMIKYKEEHGQPWLSIFGRGPPILHIWDAGYVGQSHTIESEYGQWDGENYAKSYTGELKVVAMQPKVLLIENLISPAECEHIIKLGEPRVRQSIIGVVGEAYADETRTSKTGWINPAESEQLQHMFNRFADVLHMEKDQLKPFNNAEPLQVVHYGTNQHYYNHFDFFYSGNGSHKYRFSTLLLYLNNATSPAAGGGTGFPKAFGGKGLKVRPPAGSAVLFYSMMEDGNCDEYSEHTGLHVLEGEKWIANLWIWDPKR